MTDEYVTIGWIMRYAKMGRTSVYAGIKTGVIPKQIKIGRSSRWLRSEVEAALARLAAQHPTGQPLPSLHSHRSYYVNRRAKVTPYRRAILTPWVEEIRA